MTADLTTTYLGLRLTSPVVASASPLTGTAETAVRIAAAGAGAIVMPSLFEEEIVHEEIELNRALEAGSEHFAEALDYFPTIQDFPNTVERYLTNLAEIAAAVDVPVIASLNATTPGAWVRYATQLEEAGADAIEVNLYHVAADPSLDANAMEARDLGVVAALRSAVQVPIAVKLSPFYSALASFAARLVDTGADGLVLFNRFYQPDYDLETLDVVPRLQLSSPGELRLPLRWIGILHPQLGTRASLALTSGVHDPDDVIKALLAGADAAMTTSALLHNGPEYVQVLVAGLREWLDANEYESVAQLRGSASHAGAADPSAFERANYYKILHSWAAPIAYTPTAPK